MKLNAYKLSFKLIIFFKFAKAFPICFIESEVISRLY